MATAQTDPGQVGGAPVKPTNVPGLTADGGTAAGQALVPVPRSLEDDGEMEFSAPVARLPVELDVAVPVREFRVRHLLALEPGRLIETQWGHGDDVPLAAGEVQLAWTEFEVVETRLAVRVTRLA
ncbi:MAG: FliM/FliN family flagellar motor C-terminal domain-containing protein [Terracidiphilus sp.]